MASSAAIRMGDWRRLLLVPMRSIFCACPPMWLSAPAMVCTLITMASATILHAGTNQPLVRLVLALVLSGGRVCDRIVNSRRPAPGQRCGSGACAFLRRNPWSLGCGWHSRQFDLLSAPPDDLYNDSAPSGGAMRADRPSASCLGSAAWHRAAVGLSGAAGGAELRPRFRRCRP